MTTNKNRNMNTHFIKNLALVVAGLLMTISCSGNTGTKEKKVMEKNAKVLIVFFSHAGENYAVGNVKVGNTKLVADEIQKVTGGDEFEIVAERNYNIPYASLTKLAREEQERNEKPAFKGEVKDIDQYGIVFIGGPVWWGTYPQVMFSFFDKYNLNGKTIIPFTTHEGSGLGNVVEDLKKLYPNATFKEAFSIYGHETRNDLSKVNKWIKSLGY